MSIRTTARYAPEEDDSLFASNDSSESQNNGDTQARSRRGPSVVNLLTELPRTVVEVGMLTTQWSLLRQQAPKGEPHPVMVLPGFTAGDESTLLLRRFLTQLGYKALPWLQDCRPILH